MSQPISNSSSIKQKISSSAELKQDEQKFEKLPLVSSQVRNSFVLNYNNFVRENMILRGQGMNPRMFSNQNQIDSFYYPYNSLVDELSYNFIVFPFNILQFKKQFLNKANTNQIQLLKDKPISKFTAQKERENLTKNEEISFGSKSKQLSLKQLQDQENIKRDQIISNKQNQACQNKNKKLKLQNKQKKNLKKLKRENGDEDEETVSDFEEEQFIKRFKRKENSSVTQNENLQDSTSSVKNTSCSSIITRQKRQLMQQTSDSSQNSNHIDNQKQESQQIDEASTERSTILQKKKITKNQNEFLDLQQNSQIKITNQQLNQDLNGDNLIPKLEKLSIKSNLFQQQQQFNYEKQCPSQISSNFVKVLFQKKDFVNQSKNVSELLENNYSSRNIEGFCQNNFGNQEQLGQKCFEGLHQYYQQPSQGFLQLKQQNFISQDQPNKQDKHQTQSFQQNLYPQQQKNIQTNQNVNQQYNGKNDFLESNQIIFQNESTCQNDQNYFADQNKINLNRYINNQEANNNTNQINSYLNCAQGSSNQEQQGQKRQLKRKQRKITEKLQNKQKQVGFQSNFSAFQDECKSIQTVLSQNQQNQYQYSSTPLPQLTPNTNQDIITPTNYQRLCFSEDLSYNKTNQNYFNQNTNQQSLEEQFMNIQGQFQPIDEYLYSQNQQLQHNNNNYTGYSYQNFNQNYDLWPQCFQEQDRNKINYQQSHIKTLFEQNDETEVDSNKAYNNEHILINPQYNTTIMADDNEDEKIFSIIGEIKDNQEY
ncbi:hypothetical protein ABPG72_014210 [Tetrahymena utriculariae]